MPTSAFRELGSLGALTGNRRSVPTGAHHARPGLNLIRVLAVCVIAGLSCQPARAQTIALPDCAGLEAWASKLVPNETISLAPKVQLSSLLKDDLVVPLFGKSIASWDAKDASAVRRALQQCRRAAGKRKDKQASAQLYNANKAVAASAAPLTQMQRARAATPRQVQWLIDAQSLPGQLALAQDALKGHGLDLKKYGLRRAPTWASSLQMAPDYLPPGEIEPLIARLAQRQADLESETRAAMEELATAKEALQNAPATAEGLSTLEQLARLPALEKVPGKEADAFRNALQQKRRTVQIALQQQKAHEVAAAAAKPIDIEDRLDELLVGNDVPDVSIRGLRPGMQYEQAKRVMERDWAFRSAMGGDLMQEFAPTRRDMDRYTKTARRDGGRFEFQTMHGKVGQIKFPENYTGPINIGSAYARLEKRFGKPEKRQTDGAAVLARWRDGKSYLQVYVGNRVSGPRSTRTYRSSIVIQLWSRAYMDYLIEANERCEKLTHKPMGELSIADKQAILTGCKSP